MSIGNTVGRILVAPQEIAAGAVYTGPEIDVAAIYSGMAFPVLARKVTTALSGFPRMRIEAASRSTPAGSWRPIWTGAPSSLAAVTATTLNGAIAANAASFVLASATGIAAQDILAFFDASLPADTEFVRVKSAPSTTINPEENIAKAHATGAIVTDGVEIWPGQPLRLIDVTKIRAVVDNLAGGQPIIVEIMLDTTDSL